MHLLFFWPTLFILSSFVTHPRIMWVSMTWWPRWARIWSYPKVFPVQVGGAEHWKSNRSDGYLLGTSPHIDHVALHLLFLWFVEIFPKHLDKWPRRLFKSHAGCQYTKHTRCTIGLNELQSQASEAHMYSTRLTLSFRAIFARQTAEDVQPCKGGTGSVAEVESQRSSEKSRAT